MTADLAFEDFELGLNTARWVGRTLRPERQFEYATRNASRVRTAPAAQIIRNAPNGFSQHRIATLLLLELHGAIRLERDDAYVVAFSYGIHSENCAVLAGAGYFEHVLWRMLELGAGGLRWGSADALIREWAADGRLDRARLLRTLSEGLTRGYGNAVAKWMGELYLSLEPTLAEIAESQGSVRAMLRAPERSTLRLALDLAVSLHRAGLLEAHGFLGAVPDVAATTAANARDILRIATESAAADPTALEAARAVVAGALAHPGRDIQKAALSWLQANGGGEVAAESASLMSPSVASAFSAPAEIAVPAPESPREYRALDPWTLDSAATRMAVLLEDANDPLEVEAALHWLAGIDDPSSLSGLQRRARTRVGAGDDLPFHLARLVLAALGEDTDPPVEYSWRNDHVLPMLTDSRVEEVRQRLLKHEPPRSLLATPHSSAGWVRAGDLVERMAANDAAGLPVWRSDLAAALLRLDVDDPSRERARGAASNPASPSEAWAAMAYALGGDAGLIRTPSWWVAAARSRSPDVDTLLDGAGFDQPGQARPVDARIRVESVVEPAPWKDENATHRVVRFDLVSASDTTRPRPEWRDARRPDWIHDQPTVIPYRSEVPEGYLDRGSIARWVGLTWPRSVEFAASIGVMQLASSSLHGSEHPTLSATLEALADSPGEFGELGRSCVAFGLSAKHSIHRAQAAEIVAADLGGRLGVLELARTMAAVIDVCKATRWASSLSDAAAISVRGRASVVALLSQLLPLLDRGATGMSALLEVLDDELRRSGVAPSEPALLDWLHGFTGSSKAAKAAKSITMLAP